MHLFRNTDIYNQPVNLNRGDHIIIVATKHNSLAPIMHCGMNKL